MKKKTTLLVAALLVSPAFVGGCGATNLSIPALDEAAAAHTRHQQSRESTHREYDEEKQAPEKEYADMAAGVGDEAAEEEALTDEMQALTEVEVSAESQGGGELWRWKLNVGESYGLQYSATTDITIEMGGEMMEMMGGMGGMGGMGMAEMGGSFTDQIKMNTDLELHVERILPDGRYDLRIPVTHMVLESASGERVTVNDLPEEVRELRAYMTPRGSLEFYERVMVEVQDDGIYHIIRFSDENGAVSGSSTAAAGGVEVSARVSIDPRTGTVTTEASVRETTPQTRQVEEERPVQHIDVLPADLLSLLELPEGPVAAGDRFDLRTAVGTTSLRALEPEQCSEHTCGKLNVRMDVDNQAVNDAHAAEQRRHGDDDMMMASMAGGDITMVADIDVDVLFNVAGGQLFHIGGTSNMTTDAAGMKIEESTTFTLVFLER